ncbi:hypothetical protein Mterra_00370 [Calidithermus terrae]|uniref:Uncharacterized protein n=1 Tax=Calidithermus terrae TaxID=1408545 RepID=A0A399F139_9DEIN|nr:double-CXXCG motif protein [Calidithermus terrae]RIH90484.1 hypothetical protein Mterra_00370 [Calidithermus terrae]
MHYFRLCPPLYESDLQRSRQNPLEVIDEFSIPGIKCDSCGQIWAGSRKLYLPLAEAVRKSGLAKQLRPGVLQDSDWHRLIEDLRAVMGLPEDYQFWPGDALGRPILKLNRIDVPHDVLFPWTGEVVVSERVLNLLREADLKGFIAIEPSVRLPKKLELEGGTIPRLFVLRVVGHGWREGSNLEDMVVCKRCGRRKHPPKISSRIDVSRWDGSDFFNLDLNPNEVYVTDKAREVLASPGTNNIRLEELC